MKIAVVGTGYVGLVSGVCLADFGHEVNCIDSNPEKIKCLKEGRSPIFEPGLEELLHRNIQHERLQFLSSIQEGIVDCQAIFIAVGTPQDEDGSADLSFVEQAAIEIGQNLNRPQTLIVVKSTVPIGTCDLVEKKISEQLQKRGTEIPFFVGSNPEFLAEGRAIADFLRPDRIVIGVNESQAEEMFREIYKPFALASPWKLLSMDRQSSEMAKYASNAMLATRVSFMNELSQLAEKVGANVDKVRHAMGMDPRIGNKFLYAGPGYGGSCFPKDVSALIHMGKEREVDLSILQSVKQANENQKRHVSQIVLNHFNQSSPDKAPTVAVWGLAFKSGTDDVRESPSIVMIDTLLSAGYRVHIHDPQASGNFVSEFEDSERLVTFENNYEALESTDALILMTEWNEYRRPNWNKIKSRMKEPVIFDFRNQYDYGVLKKEGFTYYCIGRPDVRQSPNS